MLTKTWAVAVLACVCCLLWGSAIPVDQKQGID